MKTRKSLSHSHTLTAAAGVSVYDGWRNTVTITLRDEHDSGADEVSFELPENVFAILVDKVKTVAEDKKAAKLEESEVE